MPPYVSAITSPTRAGTGQNVNRGLYFLILKMESEYRRPTNAVERELHVLNQKAERDRLQKLQLLNKQFDFSSKSLQQRKDYWRTEQRKVVTVRLCEPKAIVDLAMKEINECSSGGGGVRELRTAYGARTKAAPSRSISAPARRSAQSGVSLLQMKNIALIDSISEKEKALRRQRAREEEERTRRAQMEALQRRVQEFIQRLKEMETRRSEEEDQNNHSNKEKSGTGTS